MFIKIIINISENIQIPKFDISFFGLKIAAFCVPTLNLKGKVSAILKLRLY